MTTATKNQINVSIRWLLHRDFDAVLEIERQCFQWPWDKAEMVRWLCNTNVIGMVSLSGETVVSFMVYELCKHRLNLVNFAVHEDWRFKGVGRAMVKKLVTKLSKDRRSRITLEIRETNLDAQLFFRAMGFKCVSTIRGFYEDTDEDAFAFSYRYRGNQ